MALAISSCIFFFNLHTPEFTIWRSFRKNHEIWDDGIFIFNRVYSGCATQATLQPASTTGPSFHSVLTKTMSYLLSLLSIWGFLLLLFLHQPISIDLASPLVLHICKLICNPHNSFHVVSNLNKAFFHSSSYVFCSLYCCLLFDIFDVNILE